MSPDIILSHDFSLRKEVAFREFSAGDACAHLSQGLSQVEIMVRMVSTSSTHSRAYRGDL
jgi:hypothetical protein